MKKLSFSLFFVLLFGCNNDKADLESLNDTIATFNEAFKTGDLQVLDSLTTDRYIHTNSSDRAFAKESWFNYLKSRSQQLASGQLKVDRYELLEKEVKLYENSAIVTGLIVSSGSNAGESFSSQLRVSNFWVMEAGTWKRAGFHDTKIK